jgi:hypothetical protein
MNIRAKDKYKPSISLDGGTTWTDLVLVKPVVISGSREKNCYDFKRKSSQWKFVRYENVPIYDALLVLIHAPSTATLSIKVKLEFWDNWLVKTNTEYEGYVNFSGLQVNEDNGVIEFTPTEDSVYGWYDQNKDKKHDVLNEIANLSTITYDITTELEEYWIPFGGNYVIPSGFTGTSATVGAWSALTNYIAGYVQLSWARNGGKLYSCTDDNINIEPGVHPDWADYWEIIDNGIGGEINIVYHVYRQTCDLPFTTGGHDYIHGNSIYDTGFPAVIAIIADASNCDESIYYYPDGETPKTGTMALVTEGNLKLYDHAGGLCVLNHLLTGSGLTAHSHFLSDTTHPLLGTANNFINLRLVQNKYIKGTEDYATAGEITLEQILNDLCKTCNLMWMISGTNLIIEHVEYFKKGLSYSGTTTVYADLTNKTTFPLKWQTIFDVDGTTSDKEYSLLEDAVEFERFHFVDGYDYDGEIRYDSAFAKKGEENKHDIISYITDFAFLFYFPSETADDIYSLIACDATGKVLRRSTRLRWTTGNGSIEAPCTKTKTTFPNGDLQWDNLLNDFWKYQVAFKTGHINGKYTSETFTTLRKTKKQRKVRIPRLVAGEFLPNNTIITNLGTGEIDAFGIDSDVDFIEVTLLYPNET